MATKKNASMRPRRSCGNRSLMIVGETAPNPASPMPMNDRARQVVVAVREAGGDGGHAPQEDARPDDTGAASDRPSRP
jgi:hypothetical protein